MKKAQYGVVNPKKLDYMFALVMSIIAVGALWTGIWITASQTLETAREVLELTKKAFLFDLADIKYLVILFQSIAIYCTCVAFLTMLVLAIAKKKWRVIPGVVSILFAGFALTLAFGFLSIYANQLNVGVTGLFAVVLGALFVLLFVLIYKIFKCTYILLGCDNAYQKYLEDDGMHCPLKNEKVDEKPAKAAEKPAKVEAVAPKEEKVKEEAKPKEVAKKEKPAKVEKKSESFEVLEQQTEFGKANHFTFEQKLKMAKPVARQYFKDIKKYFEELGFKSNLTKSAQTFTYKNTKYAITTTAGKSGLKVYFKLDPANYKNLTIPFTDASDKKKYEKTPFLFIVKSDLAVRRAKALMDDIKKTLENEEK